MTLAGYPLAIRLRSMDGPKQSRCLYVPPLTLADIKARNRAAKELHALGFRFHFLNARGRQMGDGRPKNKG